jgi:hypothetical protein
MRALIFTLMCMIATLASAATVYKWVDENGVTHYSDQPHPGAQKITVEAAQTYKSSAGQVRGPPQPPAPRPGPAAPNYICSVSRPAPQEMFQNTDTVPGNVHIDPALRPTDHLSVMLDGAPVSVSVAPDADFSLTGVFRGSHQLSVRVQDASGTTLCESGVPFFVRQASLLSPANPNRPQQAPPPQH